MGKKNFMLAAAMGLILSTQSLMPVSAAEAVPFEIVRCPKCRTALNTDEQPFTETIELGRCTLREHQSLDCYIYEIRKGVYRKYVCPNGDYESTRTRHTNSVEEKHRSVS